MAKPHEKILEMADAFDMADRNVKPDAPTGANTTVREWLAIKNTAGAVRYIPLY
jgi:hypothetical protein